MADPCDVVFPDALIEHDFAASYCELCEAGSITIEINNPFDVDTDMINMTVVEDLGASGLTYGGSVSVTVNGTGVPAAAPQVTGVNNEILTWTSGEIGALARLSADSAGPWAATNITIVFSVVRDPAFTEEGLVSDPRNIQATLSYSSEDVSVMPAVPCPASPDETDDIELTLREPIPSVTKLGRNVDAGQGVGFYDALVYGNIDDDIIWRIEVDNAAGTADLQDLRLDDIMDVGSLSITDLRYICDSEFAANNVAVNNVVDPAACVVFPAAPGDRILDYDVDMPFAAPTAVDVPAGGSSFLYLVGKIPNAPNGSCSTDRDNTVSDIQWGCEVEPPAGGISTTSTLVTPAPSTATLNTLSSRDLDIAVDYDGVGAGNPVAGTKGRVVITITNNSGGTVSDLVLTNDLPPEYVADNTFTPTIVATGAYGVAYDGLTNDINWDNENPSLLLNTDPQFTLTSLVPNNDGHSNLLRHGDELVITFGIVLVRSASYDRQADLDVITETHPAGADGDDPNHGNFLDNLPNTVDLTFNDFCTGGPNADSLYSEHDPDPEDLDIQTIGPSGPVLDYIITNNTDTTLSVRLTNNGGHGASDFYTYVAFGRTMDVDTGSLPTGCTDAPVFYPGVFTEWQTPIGFPPGATIIECVSADMAVTEIPDGTYVDLDFVVSKSTDPADIAADDLTFRAEVIGEITLSDSTLLTVPAVVARGDGVTDRANTYSVDAIRARVMGFNLTKDQNGNCSENNPPPGSPDDQVQIGEECYYNLQAGGWFGFLTPGYTPIHVRNVRVEDTLPDGQGYVESSDPEDPPTTAQIDNINFDRVGSPPVPPHWDLLGDLEEGELFWTFNDAGNYITQRDEWFEVNIRTRLLNDPVNSSAPPNQHADPSTNTLISDFDVVFLAGTGSEFTVPYDDSMSVYPPVAGRQVILTVTEPDITVVKEVCNESLSGTGIGPACTPFVALADNGDALNDYIYRLRVTNEADSGGVTRAPAYDVTITDTLDASDLAYVVPFGADGLNNDGDAATDGADGPGEGSISNNTVNDTIPAVITFSYTHSSALERIDPGDTVELYYRVDFDDDAAPLQTFTNSAVATYDSLEGASGNQTAGLERANGDIAGAREYTSAAAEADVQIIPIETQPKRITALANTPIVGAGTQGASIGEEIEYRLNTLLPVALLRNFVIRDELPAGLRCSEAPDVDLDAAPYDTAGFDPGGVITPTCTDSLVEWNFGDQRVTAGTAGLGNRYDFEIGFVAIVENTAGTNDTDVLSNGDPATSVTASYVDEASTTITEDFTQVDVRVDEPAIDLTKDFAVANADAGDILTVTVTATNSGTATAYNLSILDDLTGTNLTYTGTVGGANPPDTVDTTTFGANQPVFIWNSGIAAGAGISFTFDVSVDAGVQPHEVLENTIEAMWTSLPDQTTALNSSGMIGADGSATGMRNGALPNAGLPVNDYEATATDSVVVPAATLTKTDLNPAAIPTIGVHKSFQVDITLPEGVTNDLDVTDTLDSTGLSYVLENEAAYDITYTFQGIATINGVAPSEAALNAFPADETSNSAVWDIGTVVTQTENDTSTNAIDPLIRINYFARINNDAVTDAGDTLQNSVEVTYTNGETSITENLNDTTALQTVLEPLLGMTKTVANVTNPGNPPQGGDVLRYTLAFTASGGAGGDNFSDAFDLRIDDSMTLGLIYNGNPTVDGAGNTIGAPIVTGDGVSTPQTLRWSLEDANADIDIVEGTVVTVTYDVLVDNSVLIGQSLTNSATAQWTGLDGPSIYERNGTATPAYNDYYIGPESETVVVGDTTATAKTRLTDTYGAGDDVVRIGDILEYELRLSLQGGSYDNVVVTDTLPQGLLFEEIASINGDTTAPYAAVAPFAHADIAAADISVAGTASLGPTTVTMNLGDIVNVADGDPTNDVFIVIYRARVLNLVHPQLANIPLTNTADMDYDTAGGPATTVTDDETIDVRQPDLAVTKTGDDAGGDGILDANELVTYTVDIANSGTAPAYDTEFRDIIPVGMRNGTATITMVSVTLLGGPTVLPILNPVYDAATGVATWDFDTGTADQYTIPPGDTLRIVYQVETDAGLGPGMTLTNQAQVQFYYSFDDDAVPTLGGAVGVREIYGPSNMDSVTFTTAAAEDLDKANTIATAAIGQPFNYRITIPATPMPTALHDVRILDDLTASVADLTFIRVTRVSGSQPWTPVNTGTATSLVIEDTTVGIDIPAGEQIEIDITVRLDDAIPPNASLTLFANTASYTFNQINGDAGTQMAGGADTTADMTIVGPDDLTMEKSGPATMLLGTPGAFTLNVHNIGSGTAWNATITDMMPDGATGGYCDAGPSNITAAIYEADGTTLVANLVENTDYVVNITGAPACEWTLTLLSASGGIGPNRRLIINYEVSLDADTVNGTTLTNVAGATQWYSYDPNAADAAPRLYTRTLNDGTVGTLDHEDAHTVNTEAPVLEFYKHVVNLTTGQDPGLNASPGDTLRYTLQVINGGPVGLPDFSISDELDDLNAPPLFEAGSLALVSVPAGADTSGTDPLGGVNGTGLVQVDDLVIGAQGAANDTVEVVFDITLVPVIDSGTVVRNQAGLVFSGLAPQLSDDPNIGGATDPTETLITSAPLFQVQKTSAYLDGDPAVLMAGERIRYTITIKNIGTENAVNTILRDTTPANTTYMANSTTLNGNPVADAGPGVSPLTAGILINAPEDLTPGFMRADTDVSANNVATVTFEVRVDADAMDGLVIENQGFVSSDGVGSGPQPDQPSDDPGTPVPDDPTRDVVGNLPLLYAHKTVAIFTDFGTVGIVDPGDVLRYTITIRNTAAIDATGVVLTDAVPTNTAYVADSIRLNGAALPPDGGVLPLIAGLPVQSSDNPGAGIITAGQSAVITFEVTVNLGLPVGTIIMNQGTLTSNELTPQLTDADGLPDNGYQPTIIVVGDAQLVTIAKSVTVVGGGPALAGSQLEYVVLVNNVGSVAATNVVLTDDLNPPLGTLVTYVAGSGTLDGAAAGVTFAGGILTGDYAATYGALAAGDSCELRFRVQINGAVPIGTTITNTGVVTWNSPSQSDSASVSIDVGGTPGSGTLNGNVWHDASLDAVYDVGEVQLAGWSVALYRNGSLATTVTTDASGAYHLGGLLPNAGTSDVYQIRFSARGAGVNAAALGYADSVFTDGPHRISDIVVDSGDSLQNLNLPIQPNGTVYDSVVRVGIRGATVTMRNAATNAAVSDSCFDDPNQQNQVTADEGYYKFDMNFSQGDCPAGSDYLIEVTPPASGYMAAPSQIIPPDSDASTPAFDVPGCPGTGADAVPGTPGHCEVVIYPAVPPVTVLPRTAGTTYHLHLTLSDGTIPGDSQIFNNPIPLDPEMSGATAIAKTVSKTNVTRSSLVPYTVTVTNVIGAPLYNISITDRFPAGFKYVEGSARLNGAASEPQINGRELVWDGLELQVNERIVIQLLLVVGGGVSEGEYVNRAQVSSNTIGENISGEASATVRVIPDPDFDCTDIIGKVFDDNNLDGRQDAGEKGLAGIRLITVRGLIATTDANGRFHITCAAVPDEDRGGNFILKLDERSLPTGYRLTTENPRVQRATRGKMMRFNFGATIHSVVRMDIADGAFEPDSTKLRIQWAGKIDQLVEALQRGPSLLRLSYLGDVESKALVDRRLDALKESIEEQWQETDGSYPLTIETEVFWRRGASFNKR